MESKDEKKLIDGSLYDLIDENDKKEILKWYDDLVIKFRNEVAVGSVGAVDMSGETAKAQFKAAREFWKKQKPVMPKINTRGVTPLELVKTQICIVQIKSLFERELKADIKIDDDD